MARVSYQSVYLIDYFNQSFLYVSDNPLFLCGHSAEEVKELSEYMQIIMITHQAIIAAKSDKHFYIKKTQNDKTDINVYVLEGENKLKGIAELVSGEITDESLRLAATLCQ